MAADAAFGALLSQLGAEIGLPELRPDGAGRCVLVFDGRVRAVLIATGAMLAMVVDLGVIPQARRDAALDLVLDADLLLQAPGRPGIAVDPTTGHALLIDTADLTAFDYPTFSARLDAFVGLAERWAAMLGEATPGLRPEDLLRSPRPPVGGVRA